MKLGVRITVHGDSGLDASDDEGRVVKTIFGRESELLFCCLGRQFHIGGDGTEVGHDAEDTLGLFCSVGADGVGVCRLRWRLRGGLGGLSGLRIEKSAGRVGKLVGWKGCGAAGWFVEGTGAAGELLSAERQRGPG